MKHFLVVVVVACVFLAFFVLINHSPQKKADSASPAQQPSGAKLPAAHVFDVGDAEAALHLDGVLGTYTQGAHVKEEKLLNMRQDLDMTTITVTPPAPKELWVQFTVNGRRPLDGPVAMRGKIFRDKEEMKAFATVILPQKTDEARFGVDVFAGLETPPASMLVHAEAEVILLNAGVDPATVDPNTVTAAPGETGHLLSNPVKVELNAGEGK